MKLLFPTMIAFLLFAFNSFAYSVTNPSDYNQFLSKNNDDQIKRYTEEYNFWKQKLDLSPGQFPYMVKMAAAKNMLFKATGEIEALDEATQLLETASFRINCTDASMLRSLAKNYITEHRFREALNVLLIAKEIGTNISGTGKMLFDTYMEIGEYENAEHYLNTYCGSLGDFDYLIRRSKWEDHSGNLSQAIYFMKRALEIVKEKKQPELIQWTTTNLADYFGHDGQILKSYKFYLKALEMNPGDAYAKKGIAWIAYSHERNVREANRILNSIEKYYSSPDHTLFKAEMAEYENKVDEQNNYIQQYLKDIQSKKAYGSMYNKYLIPLYADDASSQSLALKLAKSEVQMRPNAQSYSLLAWVYHKMGKSKEAKDLVLNNVNNKTYEPDPLLVMAEILYAHPGTVNMKNLSQELAESVYELGPVAQKKINALQNT